MSINEPFEVTIFTTLLGSFLVHFTVPFTEDRPRNQVVIQAPRKFDITRILRYKAAVISRKRGTRRVSLSATGAHM